MPERVIFECYKTLFENASSNEDRHHMLIKTLDSEGRSLRDTVYPEWPCILVGNRRVSKNNILVFLKKICTLNDKFRSAKYRNCEETIKRMEVMCQTQLHLVTVSQGGPLGDGRENSTYAKT